MPATQHLKYFCLLFGLIEPQSPIRFYFITAPPFAAMQFISTSKMRKAETVIVAQSVDVRKQTADVESDVGALLYILSSPKIKNFNMYL